jgi:hypothetical protein
MKTSSLFQTARAATHSGFVDSTRLSETGYLAEKRAGRTGRAVSAPPQFGQVPERCRSAQSLQNVHSKLQIIAAASHGRSMSQHSQFGRISSMASS